MIENPKELAATRDKKAPLDLVPPAANELAAWALADGARKYGQGNYKTIPVSYRCYLGAIKRHADALLDGEDYAEDSGAHHIGHVLADGAIIADALKRGNLVDDRGPEERSPEQEARSAASNGVPANGVAIGEGIRRRIREQIAEELRAAAARDGDWYSGTTARAIRVVLGGR